MKKIILAAAVILTTGVITVVTNSNDTKNTKATVNAGTTADKAVIATAD